MNPSKTAVPHPRATWIHPDTGERIDMQALMQEMAQQEAVLLGETHNIAEIHRWQLHVTAALHTLRPDIMVGFEMFPRRLQPVLDEWVAGRLDTETFIKKSEWYDVWGFPPEIYLPVFHFCRQQNIRMLALNCYRPLVTRVGKEGWENIPEEERDGLTPAAPATDAYREYLATYKKTEDREKPVEDRFVRAMQAWDRAFACNIVHALNETEPGKPKPLIIGIIGRGHLEFGHGTPYQLKDLGINKVSVLLPSEEPEIIPGEIRGIRGNGIARALFRLDTPEPPVEIRSRNKKEPEEKTKNSTPVETAA